MEVPPIALRRGIVREAHASMGYPHGHRLYQLLRSRYYWPGLHRDCVATSTESMAG